MALINQNSIIGVTSITSPSASNVLTVHTNDTTERLRVSTSGVSFSGTNASLDTSGNISAVDGTFTGNVSIGGTLTYEDVTNIDSVGIVTARNGIDVSTGNVTITENSNVMFQNSARDTNRGAIQFTDGGVFRVRSGALLTEKLRITSDGKVGIGTDMGGSPASNYGFGVYRASGTGYVYTETAQSGASAGLRAKAGTADFTIYTTEGTGQLAVYDNTNNAERLKIDSSGKLKLGSNTLVTPSTDADNFVIDTGDVDSGLSILSATTGRIYFGDAASNDQGSIRYVHTDNSMRFETNSSERVRINSVGNMGIGGDPLPTSTGYDGATLHLRQSANSGGSALRMTNGSTGHTTSDGFYMGYWQDGHLYCFNQESGHIIVGTNGTERFRIASDGKIHVGGNGTGTDQLNVIAAGSGINIARGNSGSPSVNEWLGALGFKGYATGNSSAAADARIHAVASHNHSGSSAPANLIFSTKPTTTGPGSAPTERMRLTHDGKLMIGGTDIGGTNASRLGMTYGNSTGNYIEMGGTNRNANGLSKLVTMRHGYWGGAREVASIGFLTSSSSGGAGRGTGNFVVHTGSSGNGDGGNSGDNLSIERLRVGSSGVFYVNTTSAVNWSQTSNSSNSDSSNGGNPSGNMCFRSTEGALILANDADAGYAGLYINKFDWSSGDDTRWISFYLNGSIKDSITWNGSNIIYGNGSDYRIKTNIRSYTGGINLVKQIQVRQYDYIETERGTDHVGFIAHELQEVLPDAVSGEKDGMRIEEETGEEVMDIQMVDHGKLTPILTAALKEAIAKIEVLEAKVAALEGS